MLSSCQVDFWDPAIASVSYSSIKVGQESKKWLTVVANLDFNLVACSVTVPAVAGGTNAERDSLGRFVSLASGLV